MGMELDPTLAFWHQILALIVDHFLGILDIHGQISGKVIDLNIPTDPQPRIFLDHIKLLSFFFVFSPFLERKTRSIVGHLEIDQDPTCPRHLVLNIKDHSFKDNAVLFCRDINHRSDFCLIQLRLGHSLFGLEIKGWFFLCWWWSHLRQGLHGPQGFFISCLEDLILLSLEGLMEFFCQLVIRLNPTLEMRKTKLGQLTSKIRQMVFPVVLRIHR